MPSAHEFRQQDKDQTNCGPRDCGHQEHGPHPDTGGGRRLVARLYERRETSELAARPGPALKHDPWPGDP